MATGESTETKILKAIEGLRREIMAALEDYLPRREAEMRFKRLEEAPARMQGGISLGATILIGVIMATCSSAGFLLSLVNLLATHWKP